jgi:ribose-phosphate pyrophosphokinase
MYFVLDDVTLLYTPKTRDSATRIGNHLVLKIEESERYKFQMHEITPTKYNNGELDVQIPVNVRGRHAYVIHAFVDGDKYDPDIGLSQLELIDEALWQSSVGEITYVLADFPYQRKERTTKKRTPISVKRKLGSIINAHPSVRKRIVCLDLHSDAIMMAVECTFDQLNPSPLFAKYIMQQPGSEKHVVVAPEYPEVVVSPDVGGTARAREFAKFLHNNDLAIIDKRRPKPGEAEIMNIIGDVKNRHCLVRDDKIDTGKTTIKGVRALMNEGAKGADIYATHGEFNPDQDNPEWIPENEFRKLYNEFGTRVMTTDSIPHSQEYIEGNRDWLTVISNAPILASGIYRIQTRGSISELIEGKYELPLEIL